MTRPAVTIVMPVFNARRFVAAAIESILAQTFGSFEFLIYDDGSVDGSRDIIADYARRDRRIRYFPVPHQGYVAWLNRGIEEALAPLIARMDADDLSLPERLEAQLDYLRLNDSHAVVGSDYLSIDEDGEPLAIARHATRHDELLHTLLDGRLGVIAHPTAVYRREAAKSIGGYRQEFEPTEDLDFWLRLSRVGQLGNIGEVLLQYRHHPASVCYTAFDQQQRHVDEIVNSARTARGLPPLVRSVWPGAVHTPADQHRRWGRWALGLGNRHAAIKHLRAAVALNRRSISSWLLLAAASLPRPVSAAGVTIWRFLGRRARLHAQAPRGLHAATADKTSGVSPPGLASTTAAGNQLTEHRPPTRKS